MVGSSRKEKGEDGLPLYARNVDSDIRPDGRKSHI